ncbi:hypothetical protein Hanom_Chr04g00380781 [Helianthus anomalus]
MPFRMLHVDSSKETKQTKSKPCRLSKVIEKKAHTRIYTSIKIVVILLPF